MSQVKWVNESNLRETPFGDTVCGKEVQVLPLAALQGVVEGLRLINTEMHFVARNQSGWSDDKRACRNAAAEAQRLLALLGEGRKS